MEINVATAGNSRYMIFPTLGNERLEPGVVVCNLGISVAMHIYKSLSINIYIYPGIPTTIKTMGVNITTIVYLGVLIIQIGSTIVLMVVEA